MIQTNPHSKVRVNSVAIPYHGLDISYNQILCCNRYLLQHWVAKRRIDPKYTSQIAINCSSDHEDPEHDEPMVESCGEADREDLLLLQFCRAHQVAGWRYPWSVAQLRECPGPDTEVSNLSYQKGKVVNVPLDSQFEAHIRARPNALEHWSKEL